MIFLLIVSFVWAFSFGMIKVYLISLDSNFVAWARMVLSMLIFIPFLKIKTNSLKLNFQFMYIGIVQYGIMYMAYIYSFQFLKASEVALFTIFTPIYVTLINDIYKKQVSQLHLVTAFLAVLGTGIIVYRQLSNSHFLTGFLFMQLSNLCFAFGQIYYRELMKRTKNLPDYQIFGIIYLGAVLVTSMALLFSGNVSSLEITQNQLLTLLYLGIIASGIGFFLWNYGARRVNGGTLAVMNNIKIPLAVAISLLFFNEQINTMKLLIGGTIILIALIISEKSG